VRSPTARTKRYLEAQGAIVDVVEKWIPIEGHPGGGVRRDLFGVIDILCIRDSKLVAIQSTSGSNHAKRIAKAVAEPKIKAFLATSNQFQVWSWSKRGARGKRKLWQPRIEMLYLHGGNVETWSVDKLSTHANMGSCLENVRDEQGDITPECTQSR